MPCSRVSPNLLGMRVGKHQCRPQISCRYISVHLHTFPIHDIGSKTEESSYSVSCPSNDAYQRHFMFSRTTINLNPSRTPKMDPTLPSSAPTHQKRKKRRNWFPNFFFLDSDCSALYRCVYKIDNVFRVKAVTGNLRATPASKKWKSNNTHQHTTSRTSSRP
jgi:hypothetical protein